MEVRNDISLSSPLNNNALTQSETPGGEINRDTFLKLLVAQLEHQDPMSPMENVEFTAQLAQFRSLEQMEVMSNTLSRLTGIQDRINNAQAINLIGKQIKAAGNVVHLPQEGGAPLNYMLASESAQMEVRITNETGHVVRLMELAGQESGEHELLWDGLGDQGQPVPPGQYRFQVIAQSENGTLIDSETRIQGVVDGIEYADEHPLLLVQGNKVAFDSVIAVASDL